jgi:hypothetical protein
MNIHIVRDNVLSYWYSLLADICYITKCPLDAPNEITYDWVLKEAPMLEKQALAFIEGHRVENPEFPDWLQPLWDRFLAEKRGTDLQALRQLLLFCYKIVHEPSHEQNQAAQAAFEETDESVRIWDQCHKHDLSRDETFRSARQIVGAVIYRINWKEVVPKHGPGAVYPPAKPCDKSNFLTYYPTICQRYPYDQYFCGIPSFWEEVMVSNDQRIRDGGLDIVAKLVSVPKDSRGPRLICVHPREAIWIQQGQRELLESAITRSPLTRGRINFTDQSVNGRLALESSSTQEFVTLDLKEASDRMSADLVRFLFGDYAFDWLSCARATHIKLFDGRVMKLQKWAPMGNCLTFPVQSLVFYSVVRAGIREFHGTDCEAIYVFGDDIIYPSKYHEGALRALVKCGFVPNFSKTFVKGLFRESCGVDAYSGIDVTPLRLKETDVNLAQSASSLCNLAKRLRLRGFTNCSASIYSSVIRRWGRLPFSNDPGVEGLVEYVDRDLGWLLCNERSLLWSNRFHCWRIRHRLVRSSPLGVSMGYWYNLQDSLIRLIREDREITERGTEYPDPYLARLTYGWTNVVERQR